ncbi:MAG: helicase-exonuclease AddAB subunit AddA [Clostridia bacterium]|nr:helicase-exonuclease AddAB subunit AddA [Clostridia bacterium]
MKWTNDQQKAISSVGNTIVTAAAGSGKTAVLVERVIQKLSDENNPISADRLLIVTFTNAAAAEMRRRIEKALSDKCILQPQNTYLLNQRLLISSADICTIDSFCIRLVRNNFSTLGISPDFKIADEVTDSSIKLSVCKKLFNEYFEKNDLDFLSFLNITNSEYGTANAEATILEINEFCQKMPQGYKWLKAAAERYNPENINNSEYLKLVMENALNDALGWFSELTDCRKALLTDEKTDLKYGAYFDDFIAFLSRLINALKVYDWDECYSLLCNLPQFISRFSYSKNYDRVLFDSCSATYKAAKKFITKVAESFSKPLELIKKDFEFSYKILLKIYEIVCEFNLRYTEQLNKKSLLTFALVELLTLKLLTTENEAGELQPSRLSAELSSMYDEIMVDEYQDINDLQGEIFKILSDDCKKLFTVGDIKQSIYGFRGSNPEIFSKRSDAATVYSTELAPNELKRVVLSNNFRSRKEVCDFINAFFGAIMSKKGGEIEYDKNEMLYPLADFPENSADAVEAYLISSEDEATSAEAEAIFFADYVEKVLKEPAFLRGTQNELRKATYGDFALLIRSGTHLNEYLKELKKRNIPVSVGAGDFFETTEIMTAVSLIKAVENPMDDISVLSVMLSPLFGFSEDDVARLKLKYKGKKLYIGVLNEAESNKKCSYLKEKISLWRSYAACMSAAEFVSALLIDSGYANIVLSMPDAERRQANLYFLEQLADSYFSETSGDLTGFIGYLKYLKSLNNTPSAVVSGSNSVKISTMHKSKGLQYPITVLGGLGSKFSNMDIVKDFLMNEKLGVAFKYVDDALNVKQDNFAVPLLKSVIRKKQAEEEMRLLYVAMTRAEERLVLLISVAENFKDKLGDTACETEAIFDDNGKMLPDAVMNSFSYSDWLIPVLIQTPSGIALLKENGEEMHKISSLLLDSNVKVEYFKIKKSEKISPNKSAEPVIPNCELKRKIEDALNYEYPFSELNKIEVKTSVSELTKRSANREFSLTSKPAFLSKSGLTPTERGTALHKFMQYADFNKAKINPKDEVDRLYEYEFISSAEAEVIDLERVQKFVESDLFYRILNSNKLYREQRFLLDVRAGDIYPDISDIAKEQTVIVQGAVDCMFEEDDHIVIIDFKTDRTTDENFLLNHYSEQLKTYSVAAEKMFGKPVRECYIYSLYMSKTIKVK